MAIKYCIEHGIRTMDQIVFDDEDEVPTQTSLKKRKISLLNSSGVTLLNWVS